MSEIKSTMEMVMKRAAEMAAAADDSALQEDTVKDGMRCAAAYLRGEPVHLAERLESAPEISRRGLRQGMIRSLLRNILLPREEDQKSTVEKAMHGLVAVSNADRQLMQLLGEMTKITDGYLQHLEQVKDQLEKQFARQMEMMEQNLARQTGVAMKLQPSQHPKFQEEWARVKNDLNSRYGDALEQLKEMVEENLTRSADR